VSRLDALEAAGNQRTLACVTRGGPGHRSVLIAQFLGRFGAPRPTTYELFGDEVLRRANALSFGRGQLPTLDLANARHVLSVGADFLGTWNSPVAQGVGYGLMRQGRPGIRGSLVQVESRMSQTGANADEWVPERPGTEGALALGLAHVIMTAKLYPASAAGRAGALVAGWDEGLVTCYGNEPAEMAVFWRTQRESFAPLHWTMIAGNFVLPIILMGIRRFRTITGCVIASIGVIVGMWLERARRSRR